MKQTSFFDRPLLAVIGISFLLLAITLMEPFGHDNAVLHSMAMDWIKLGRVPYIGSWDNNFPGVVYVHTLSILLFGTADVAYRMLDLIIELLFAIFLYRFLLRWFRPHAAALGAILYVAVYVSSGVDVYGKQDTYGMMLQLASIAIYLPKQGRVKWSSSLLAGAVAGVSLMMRPTFLLFVGLSALAILWLERRSIVQGLLKASLFFVAAFLATLMVLLYYSTIPHGVEAIYTSLIRFNTDLYVRLAPNSVLWWEVARSGLMIPLALYAIFGRKNERRYLQRKPEQVEQWILGAFIFSILAIVLYMGKHYRYHLAPLFLLMVPLTAAGMEQVLERIRSDRGRHVTMLALVFLCSFIAYNPIAPISFTLGLLKHQNPFIAADQARRTDTLYGFAPELAAREYIDRNSSPDARVEVCSFGGFFRYHMDRVPAGPYITFHPIGFRTDGTRISPPHYTEYQRKWQQEYMDTICAAKPTFIVMARRMPFWYIKDVYDDCLHYLPGFDSLLAASYRYDTTFGGFQLYRRIAQ